jgi:aldose 1-epimerase
MPEVLSLVSPDGSASALIHVGLGFNLFDWQVDGAPLLWSHPDFATGNERPSGSGIPILFPFPGRIAERRFGWRGRDYEIDSDDGRGNAIHGFVYDRGWTATQLSNNYVRGTFRASQVDPAILDQWPADFELTVEYTLEDDELNSTFSMRSFERALPAGLGLHPYFRVPLNAAAPVELTAPLTERWPLENMNPTGQRESVELDFGGGVVVNKLEFDDVFTADPGESGTVEASLTVNQRRVVVSFDRDFQFCVLYTPPHREAICIEPYSCVPNAVRQTDQTNQSVYGLRVLEPNSEWIVKASYRVQDC